MKRIDQTVFYGYLLTGARNFFEDGTEHHDALMNWLEQIQTDAHKLSDLLFCDAPEMQPIIDDLSTLALAASLCLKTYGLVNQEPITPAESILLEHFEGHSPWYTN